jgi:hypothetical protein
MRKVCKEVVQKECVSIALLYQRQS